MKKIYMLMWHNTRKLRMVIAGITASLGISYAQVEHICGNELNQMAQEDPTIWEASEAFYSGLQEYLDNMGPMETEAGVRIIPVVVHVIHEGGTENITRNQIISQITVLNKDFKKMNSGLAQLAAGNSMAHHMFDTLAANCDIEFRLATKDPEGNCTDGIVRVYSDKTNEAKDFTDFKRLSYWDRSKYLNMWVVKSIFNDTQFGSILGYAQFPFQNGNEFPLTSTDGITIISTSFGNTGTASGGTGATTSHEIGHWLGLRHIWGDDSCASDGVDDTPIHAGPNFCNTGVGCPFPIPKPAECINLTANSTLQDTLRRDSIGEMWMNFMDYTNDEYLWMFTKGQREVFDYVFQTYAFRGNLITEANNVLTGTDDNATPCTGAPKPDFWSREGSNRFINFKMICEGENLTFKNGTFNSTITNTYAWDFPGGSPATATQAEPTITYNTAGIYDVTLAATNASGTNTKTRTGYVHVVPDAPDDVNFLYFDSFEGNGSLYEQGKWVDVNESNVVNKWEQANVGYQSFKCLMMHNEGGIQFETDAIITPSYDLTTFTGDELTFKYAYAARTNNPYIDQNDVLKVYTSTDCGSTWAQRTIKVDNVNGSDISGTKLITAGLAPNGYVPQNAGEWKTAKVDLNASVGNQDNVRIMFFWESGGPYGNNFYLDDINLHSVQSVGVEETEGIGSFDVYPNPVTSASSIYFNMVTSGPVQIDALDITGRTIFNVYDGDLGQGEQNFQIRNSQFGAAGLYLIRVTINGKSSYRKIIVE